jgi:hypothetical protein
MRREMSDGQTSDWQCAGKCIPLLTTGNIVQGDFGASLEMIIGPRSSPGSESSEDSEGVVSPTAMIIKSALRDYLLCLQCCMT